MYVSIREIDENTGNRKVDHEPNKEGNQYQSLTKLAHDPISIDPSRTKEALLSTKHMVLFTTKVVTQTIKDS